MTDRKTRKQRRPEGLGALGMALGLLALLPAALFHSARRAWRKLTGRDPGPPYTPA